MRKLAAVTAIGLLCASSALAADMRAPVAPPPAAPVVATYNWTGCYVGGGGGYGMWNQETQLVFNPTPFGPSHNNGGRGWFGTVQVGCDYQVGSNIVIGAFADYDWSGMKGDFAAVVQTTIGEEKLKSSWAAGGRIGWLPFPQLMVFVSGGYTEARFDSVTFFDANPIFPGPTGFALPKHTYTGWFLGSGYEYGIGWFPGLYWKTEYRFADYGSENVDLVVAATGATTGVSYDLHKRVQTIRSELVWRFNWGGSGVTARY